MQSMNWSHAEKKIARTAFDAALDKELAALLADFKRRALAATSAPQLWEIEDFLREQRRDIDRKYDFRYSQLIMVLGRLLREGWLHEQQLAGLGEDKLALIRRAASL
jgi:predicted transcriptional regulator